MIKTILRYSSLFIIFCLLTVLTQVGGLIMALSIWLCSRFNLKKRLFRIGVFMGMYLVSTFIIIPPIAKLLGRQAMPISSKGLIIPNHIWNCLLNRHYVKPELFKVVTDVSNQFNKNKDYPFRIRYLDANFPFLNEFPLLPHRSHDDGEKLDLAFMYVDRVEHKRWDDRVSFLGYGFCEEPLKGEDNTPKACARKGYWQYSLLTQSFGLGTHQEIQFDEFASAALVKALSKHPSIHKIFIEPHLKNRLGFGSDPKVRFHGCAAVRHDDHIHIEL